MNTRLRRIPSLSIMLALALLLAAPSATAALATSSTDGFWHDVAQSRIAVTGQRRTIPERYRTIELARSAFEAALELAPPEKSTGAGVQISLPMPDGSFQQFLVEYSPVMEPQLAQMHPEISTYLAVASDNAAITARLDLTPAGFHAIVFRPEGTVYIDPYQTGSGREYISYYKRELRNGREPFYCGVTGQQIDASQSLPDHDLSTPVGDVLNTYRLAVAATAEYTSFHGGTSELGLAAIVTTINRVTGIYERELSVRLSLVANNLSIIYTNAATDPYTNSNPDALLDENQENLDTVIGSENYDIGHVFSTGGGGLAGLGVVCNDFRKAHGETGLGVPTGDPFDVDFVAHEIGHQFGGNHTFNGSSGNCSGGNRNGPTAYEPGSGSTIQAYAGICGAENLQLHSDDYFHTISFEEMVSHVTGDGNCGSQSITGNTAPASDAGASYTVPIGTPLLLRASDAVDPDAGQVLTYSWEQLDLGNAGPPNTDNGNRPIFRSFPAQTTKVRYLPRMSDILANTSTLGESMPATDRSLTFRLTVRDNAPGGGGVDFATVVHQTTTSAGPFTITSQNAPVTWVPGSEQTISWEVADTTSAPVNCANVDIIFSESGFPDFSGTSLLTGTPNDGSATITAPLEATGTGRVMVWCNSNIFFDVNDAAITIPAPGICGNSILDLDEQCDDGNSVDGDGCSASCQVESGWSCSLPVPPVADSNVLPEGGFEGGTPSPAWTEASTSFVTPLCRNNLCGGSGEPNTGEWYAWFGGIALPESGSVEQEFLIEEAYTELTFARRLALCDSADDSVSLMLDGNTVWQMDGADPACGETDYFTETIDLATAPGGPFNDDLSHLIRIESSTLASNGGSSNFFIDDVSILGGGSPAQPSECISGFFRIGGSVSGLAGSGLVLQNNGGDDLEIGGDGGFTFATLLADGSDYAVTVLSQPTGLSQTCAMSNDSGTLNGADVSGVAVNCVTDTFTIGGTVSGLAGSGLILQYNDGDDLEIGADGGFTFATALADGNAYAVTILSQPGDLSQTCTLSNGTGALAGADIDDVTVTCVTDSFTIGGTVSGLSGSGLVLQNNAGDDLEIGAEGDFTFATPLADGSDYVVTVLTQPSNLSQACTLGNDSGTLAGADIDDVTVICVTDSFAIGGTVSGLAGSGLVLQNNIGDDLEIGSDGGFTFATPLADGSDYAVTVLTQPSNLSQTCTIFNDSGTLAGADIGDLAVDCTTDTFTIGGTVSGLAGSGLVLQNNAGDDLDIGVDGDFTFATPLADGSDYAVTVSSQPTGQSQTCTISNENGTLAGADIDDLAVDCVTDTFTIGGTVSGLAGSGLVLQNNAGDDLAIEADGSFTFTTPLVDGSDYAVTVLTQQTDPGQTCTLSKQSGTLDGVDIVDIAVTCASEIVTVDGFEGKSDS